MKRTLFFLCWIAASASVLAQTTKPAAKPAAKTPAKPPMAQQPGLKTLNDSAAYAIGLSMAAFYKRQGVPNLNTALISRAINDVYNNKPALMTEMACNDVMNKLMMQIEEEKVKPTIDAGNAFLAENKKRPGVRTTASGLQYEVITEGTGIKPTAQDTFVCHYRGTLIDGTEFDASAKHGQPLVLPVTSVIRGWTEGLQLMSVGSKYKFYIPYTLGYGPIDNGAIPGGSALIFEVELLDVKRKM